MLFQFFLATDVLRLGERPIDATGDGILNPKMNNVTCANCHEKIDPLAGALQNWSERGQYDPLEEGWYTNMRQPGFGEEIMAAEETLRAAQWVAEQIVNDSRFAIAPVHILFEGLSGQKPLREPSDVNSPTYLPQTRAFDVQSKVFQGIADQFVENNWDLKTVVKEIIKSPYFRAVNAESGFEIAGAFSAIRVNIQSMQQRMLGEFLDLNDPEIDRTYQLYVDAWREGRTLMNLGPDGGGIGTGLGNCGATNDPWTGAVLPLDRQITDDETYSIWAWQAVTAYLFADYRFLHE